MSLGLSELTDDQLVELLQEACQEIIQRDPVVRKAAQGVIDEKAEEQRIQKEESKRLLLSRHQKEQHLRHSIRKAIKTVRLEYLRQLEKDVADLVRQDIVAGKFRPMTPEEEAEKIAAAATVVEVRVHIAQGFSPPDMMKILEKTLRIPEPVREDMNVLRCLMNGEQVELFKKTPAFGAHRLEFV